MRRSRFSDLSSLSSPFFLATLILLTLPSLHGSAQTTALTAADRQALLYAPQLSFARNGEPIIRLGIDETKTAYSFVPSTNIFVLPSGKGGPTIELPKNQSYTVKILDGNGGKYVHAVTVERIPFSQQSLVEGALKRWKNRGFQPEVAEVGGLFSVSGHVFDSRLLLINIGKTTSSSKARALQKKVEQRHGVIASVHSVLSDLPDGKIELSSPSLNVKITTDKVLSVVGASSGDPTIFTIPNLQRNAEDPPRTRRYVGELVFAPARNGRLVVMVNTNAERVLKGTVPSETFPQAPAAALQAQAVAARNNLLSGIGVRNLADPYMLRTDVMDQVYNGIDAENVATTAAVDATRGKVMMWEKRIINAVYSSNAAGYTVNNEDAWDMAPVPWLRGKSDRINPMAEDPFAKGVTDETVRAFLNTRDGWAARAGVTSSRNYRWEKEVPATVVVGKIKGLGRNIGTLLSAQIVKRGKSGRVKEMAFRGTKGTFKIEGEFNIRRLFGGLRSALFLMTPTYNANRQIVSFRFEGGGYGHGVGMCQTGAIARAEGGESVDEILRHYYSGVTLQKLY